MFLKVINSNIILRETAIVRVVFLRASIDWVLSEEVDGVFKPETHSVEVFSCWSPSSSVDRFISPPSLKDDFCVSFVVLHG